MKIRKIKYFIVLTLKTKPRLQRRNFNKRNLKRNIYTVYKKSSKV